MQTQLKHYLSAFLVILIISGCATTTPRNKNTALKESKPRSIVIIPPINNSLDVNAPYIYLSTLTRPLAEKGYYVFPVSVIDHFLKENGLPTPAEMNSIPLDKIGEHIGADAVLYITIKEWGQQFLLTSSTSTVKARLKLVDVKTGQILWKSRAFAQSQSGDGGGGLVGALIGAIVSQIASAAIDNTPTLARQANQSAISSKHSGLINGPYKKTKPK